MPFIIKPSADENLANATLVDEKQLTQTLNGMAAGSYHVGVIHWDPEAIVVTNGEEPSEV